MNASFARSYLGIGEVLVELRTGFPDVSVSKIRFLEAEGLISPARSPSGYRRFSPADVDQLRFILTAQRDEYLPLKVIKERLAARAALQDNAKPPASDRTEMVSRRELIESAGIDEAQLEELETHGLIKRSGRRLWAGRARCGARRGWPRPLRRSGQEPADRGDCRRP